MSIPTAWNCLDRRSPTLSATTPLFLFPSNFAKILAMKISAVIIAGNEEQKIGDALRSVGWADEILVVDSESTDKTCEIARRLGARVVTRPWSGFSAQKQ